MRNENGPVRTAGKRIGERLAHCTIYEARPAAERQAHDGDRAVEAFRDFCEAQRRSETGLAGFDGERLCDERYRVVAERKFAMRRLEPRHVKRLAIHFESGTEQPLRCPVRGPAIARPAPLLVAGLGLPLAVGDRALGALPWPT